MTTYSPRIYVASLSDYNAGTLHGVWIDLDGKDEDAVMEEITAMLKESEEEPAEDFAIHDSEDFGDIRIAEHEGIEEVCRIAQLLDEHGELFAIAYANFSDVDEAEKAVTENFQGEYDDLADYAESWCEGTGSIPEGIPDFIKYNIDWEGVGRDFELGGDIWTAELDGGKIAVFYNH